MPAARFYTRNDRAYRRERLVEAYQGGADPRELARRFGWSEDHVYRIVRNAGVSRSRRAGRNHFLAGSRAATQDSRPVVS